MGDQERGGSRREAGQMGGEGEKRRKGRELLTGRKEGEGTGGEGGGAKYMVRGAEQERGRRPDRAPETQ